MLKSMVLMTTVVLGLIPAAFAAPGGRQQLDHFLNDLTGFQAEFHQRLFDENLRLIEEADGTVYLQRPGRMRWEYRKPLPQIIVADGRRLWIYDPELAQVTVRDQSKGLGATPASLLSSEEPVEQRFEIRELGGRDDGSTWLALKPKVPEPSFQDIRLGFKNNDLLAMEFRDNLDQTTRLVFREQSRNPAFAEQLFQFQVPEGADVIENP